jgi:hypothetical protein
MSIYATLWKLKFPKDGDHHHDCEWIVVTAQGVPAHVGTSTAGCGYESGDPYSDFLPPAITTDQNGDAPFMRAVVFVTEYSVKGTERNGQEYLSPLLVMTGRDYAEVTFEDLWSKICDALRGNRLPIVGEIFLPDGRRKIIRGGRQ